MVISCNLDVSSNVSYVLPRLEIEPAELVTRLFHEVHAEACCMSLIVLLEDGELGRTDKDVGSS